MKFIHIADVHIGAHPEAGKAYSANREREIFDSFKRIVEECEKEKIDLLLIAGGLFHRQPLHRELKEIDYLFSKLTVTKVVFVTGSTDYIKENTYYPTFQWSKNVYPILTEDLSCVEINSLQLAIYGCSYHKSQVEEQKLLAPIKRVNQRYHILLGYGGSKNYMPFRVEELEQLSYDYVALGYLHSPTILVENKIAYAGSLEPIRITDTGKHGYIQGELTTDSEGRTYTNIEFKEFASRQYVKMEIEVDTQMTNEDIKNKLLNMTKQRGIQHMYQFVLKGKRNTKVNFLMEEFESITNIVNITDQTLPAYDLKGLEEANSDNLLGAFIRSFENVVEDSVEFMALCEGIEAIEEAKKG